MKKLLFALALGLLPATALAVVQLPSANCPSSSPTVCILDVTLIPSAPGGPQQLTVTIGIDDANSLPNSATLLRLVDGTNPSIKVLGYFSHPAGTGVFTSAFSLSGPSSASVTLQATEASRGKLLRVRSAPVAVNLY